MQCALLIKNRILINQSHIYTCKIIIAGFLLWTSGKRLDSSWKTLKIYTVAKTLFLIRKIEIVDKICMPVIEPKQRN